MALPAALKLLEKRAYTESELRLKLEPKFESSEIDALLVELKSKGWISDSVILASSVELNQGKKAIGDEKLVAKLQKRGFSVESINEALESQPETERDRAMLVAQEKIRRGATVPQLARHLAYKGFSEETIESVLDSDTVRELLP